jgi:hypothetical protein
MTRICLAVLLLTPTLTDAQNHYFGSGSVALSAFVRASYYSWQPGEIGLLVLWRGSERWYSAGCENRGSGNSEGYIGSMHCGSAQIDFVFERPRRLARVNGAEISLTNGDNVLLVDGVDNATDRPSTRSISADLAFTVRPGAGRAPAPPSPADFVSILSRSSDMASFLQCDTPASTRSQVCEGLKAK